jgi:hypothetical protein
MSATIPGTSTAADSKPAAASKVSYILMGVVLSIAVSAGTYAHGILTDRWQPANSELLGQFTERLPKLPLKLASWEGMEEFISDKEFEATNCTAYKSRRYVSPSSNGIVSMYVVSGTARHITIHSPDWCYQGAGYKMMGKPAQIDLPIGDGAETAQYLTAEFRKSDPTNPSADKALRIFWTYSDDGTWIGPKWSKTYFSGRPAMYKIYLICDISGDQDSSAEASPAVAFTKETFEQINQVLFSDSTTSG